VAVKRRGFGCRRGCVEHRACVRGGGGDEQVAPPPLPRTQPSGNGRQPPHRARAAHAHTHVAPLPVFMHELQWKGEVDATAFPEVATPAAAKPAVYHVDVLERAAAAE
jgi:hypothetical protein